MTRTDYLALFATASDAADYEARVLSIGDEFLPEVARKVRDGETDEPGPQYWSWLCAQVSQ